MKTDDLEKIKESLQGYRDKSPIGKGGYLMCIEFEIEMLYNVVEMVLKNNIKI